MFRNIIRHWYAALSAALIVASVVNVAVANEDRELEIRPVTVVRAEPRLVYISEGVSSGDMVVITTLEAPIPGTRLAISGEESASSAVENEVVASTGDGQ